MKWTWIKTIAAAIALAAAFAGCGGAGGDSSLPLPLSPAGLPQTRVVIVNDSGQRLNVVAEVASTTEQHADGLMFRSSMAADAGMLFVFSSERYLSFWMKNTYIALDMIFISWDKKIVDINNNAQPGDITPYTSSTIAKYVLEVNGGYCDANNVKIGNVLEFNENSN